VEDETVSRTTLVVALILSLLPVWSAAGKEAGMLEFMRSRQDRRYTHVPREVLAFYYTWYGGPERHGKWVHWQDVKPDQHDIASATHFPAKGAYDSYDPDLIGWHIDMAKGHGLTGFIATWWGQGGFEDKAFVTLLDRAEKKGFKATVYWEKAPGEGQAQIDKAVGDLVYILKNYGKREAFLKVDGKPVIFVYGRVMGEAPLKSWPAIITRAREESGGDFLLVADGYQDKFARIFDGIHTYNICGWVKGKNPGELREFSARSFAGAVEMAKRRGRISCITIIPGYDDTKIRKPGLKAERQDGQTYCVLWEEAIKADPDWVLVTSWNEWHEGSEIEPSWEDGDKYLRLTGEYAPRFTASAYSKAQAPESSFGLPPDKAQALRKLYEGRTIGVLPDYGSRAVFWLADVGVKLQELSWEDVLDPAVLNPKSLPIVLQAGDEHYVRTLKTDGDVVLALQRYLKEGGFLVAAMFQPYPFYHDDSAGKTAIAAGPLGFPVTGGWEKPPEGVALSFHVDTQSLPGLPTTAPFPAVGDLRWRPATPDRVAKEDLYLPLAQLKDGSGKSYGDGIVYVEHKASEPRNGRNLYVWMRMPEALGGDLALFEIFRFAASKLGEGR
jgi:hypothetical protein